MLWIKSRCEPLAAACAINTAAILQTYRWNSYVEAHRADPKVWQGPVDNDQWQSSYLTGDALKKMKFWLGAKSDTAAEQPAGTPPGTAAPPMRSTPVRRSIHAASADGRHRRKVA